MNTMSQTYSRSRFDYDSSIAEQQIPPTSVIKEDKSTNSTKHKHVPFYNIFRDEDFNVVNHPSTNIQLEHITDQIDELLNKNYDWDYMGYEEPSEKNIKYAKYFISEFAYSIHTATYSLETPIVSNSEDGGATLTWRKNGRSLYFDITYRRVSFTRVWKSEDKNTIVITRKLHLNNYVKVWEWLINE